MLNIVPRSERHTSTSESSISSSEVLSSQIPLLSIITPVLNRKDWIARAVHSVLSQGRDDVEHIIVDGGSTDGTLDVLSKFPHLRIINFPGSDSNSAMNKGITEAKGQVVGFLSSDDLYGQHTLNAVADFFRDAPETCLTAFCPAYIFDRDENGNIFVQSEIIHHLDADLLFLELLFGTPAINSWFFRNEIFAAHRPFDTSIDPGADREFLLRLMYHGIMPKKIDHASYFYAQHDGSRTLNREATLAEQILNSHIDVADRILKDDRAKESDATLVKEWRAYELNRLIRLQTKKFKFLTTAKNIATGFHRDVSWPFRLGAAQRHCERLRAETENLCG